MAHFLYILVDVDDYVVDVAVADDDDVAVAVDDDDVVVFVEAVVLFEHNNMKKNLQHVDHRIWLVVNFHDFLVAAMSKEERILPCLKTEGS